MGAWIEIVKTLKVFKTPSKSHPTWVRGLKSTVISVTGGQIVVAPYMGAWIEIDVIVPEVFNPYVAPYMGAWIEIFTADVTYSITSSRTLHGCVD